MDAFGAFHRHGGAGGGGGVTAFGAEGRVDQADAVFRQQLPGAGLRLQTPEEIDFLIADLDNVRLAEAPFDGLLRGGLALPQGLAQVGVQRNKASGLPGDLQGPAGGGGGGLIRQGQGAEMEDLRIPDQIRVFLYLLRRQAGIRAGLAGEGKVPVSALVQGDEGQGRKPVGIRQDSPGVDAGLLQRFDEEPAEGVVPDLTDHGGAAAEAGQRGQKIARGAAGIGGEDGVAVGVDSMGREIDQQLAQGADISHEGRLLSYSRVVPPAA